MDWMTVVQSSEPGRSNTAAQTAIPTKPETLSEPTLHWLRCRLNEWVESAQEICSCASLRRLLTHFIPSILSSCSNFCYRLLDANTRASA